MPFASGPTLMYVGRGIYETVGPTEYVGATEVVRIPAGSRTDLATVPRVFWALIPPTGAYEAAAVLHDWYCTRLAAGDRAVSSRDADGLFRRVMRESGVGPVTRWLMWTGVRLGALANPARRDGWWRDAPAVAAISATALAAAGSAVWCLDTLAHHLI